MLPSRRGAQKPLCTVRHAREVVVTNKPSPRLARLRMLSVWVTAIEQQSKVWLPLGIGGSSLAELTFLAPLCGISLLVFVATGIMVLDLRAQYLWSIFWSVGVILVGGATFTLRRQFRQNQSRGWVLDFQSRTLTPWGLKRQDTLVLHDGCRLSWEFFEPGKSATFTCTLILHPGSLGTRILLTRVTLLRGSRREEALVDECLEHLNRRLGLRNFDPVQSR